PVRLPGPPERAGRGAVRGVLRGALDRRRPGHPAGRPADRLPAGAGGADPALHDDHRVPRPAPRPRTELPPGRSPARAPAARPEGLGVSHLWSQALWVSVVGGGLLAGVPLMFTALGETISERAGVLNIGLEGMMLFGAYAGFLGAYHGDTWTGYLAGAAAGAGTSVFMVVLCVWLGLDQIVVGIAITLAGEGATSVLQGAQFGTTYPRLGAAPTVSIPLLDRLPILGTTLFQQPLLVYLGF